MSMKKVRSLKKGISFVCLGAYIGASLTILIESAIDGDHSSKQSDVITGQVQDMIDRNYDKNALKDIEDFNITFAESIEGRSFHAGDTLAYSVSYSPVDTSYKTLKWEIDHPELLEVDQSKQNITFLEPGTSKVTVTSDQKASLSKTFTLVCSKIEVESVALSSKKTVLNVGESISLSVSVLPKNASNKTVRFGTQNPDILDVNADSGDVKALSAGDAIVTVMSEDNPDKYDSLSIHVNPIEDPSFEIESISLNDPRSYLNYNVASLTVKGNYTNPAAKFDPKEFHVNFEKGEDLVSVSNILSSALGEFSFKLNLKDKEATRADDFAEKQVTFSASYGGVSSSPLSVAIKPIKKITRDHLKGDVAASKFHFITLTDPAMNHKVIAENVSFSIPFVSGFAAKDYYQNNFDYEIVQGDGSSFPSNLFGAPNRKYNSFSMAYKGNASSLPLSGTVYYYPDKTQKDEAHRIELPFSYEAITNSSVITGFSYRHLSNDSNEPTEFYVGQTYTSQSTNNLEEHPEITYLKDLFATAIQADYEEGTTSSVKNALGGANLTATIEAEDGLLETTLANGKITAIKFLKEGKAKITLSSTLISSTYDFYIKGVSRPNDFSLFVNDEPYSGETITIGQGEVATFHVQGQFVTELSDGVTLQAPAHDFDCRLVLPENQNSLAQSSDSLAVMGIRRSASGEPVALSLVLSQDGTDFKTFSLNVGVSYVPVEMNGFSLSLRLLDSPNEFNIGKEDGSIVPLGSTVQAQVSLPEDVTNKRVTFTSSDPSVVAVDINSGFISAIGVGEAEVRATSQDNLSVYKTKKIKVIDTVSPLTLDVEKMKFPSCEIKKDGEGNITGYVASLEYGSSYAIFVRTNLSSTSSNLSFSYAEGSSSPHAVRVDKAGNVSTVGVGEDTIRIVYSNGLQSYAMNITFKVAKNYRFTWAQLTLIVRKSLGHFMLFAFTALFSVGFLFFFFDKRLPRFLGLLMSSVLGFALAGFSELIQLYTPGRSGRWTDVGIDTGGYMATIVLTVLVYGLVLLIRFLIKKRKEKQAGDNSENKPLE